MVAMQWVTASTANMNCDVLKRMVVYWWQEIIKWNKDKYQVYEKLFSWNVTKGKLFN